MNVLVLVWAFCFLCISFGNASAIVPKLRTLVQMGQTENRADDDYSCYDAFNKPYKGRIPHPSTCNYYIMCVESGNGRPIPQLQTCGTGQLFDMNVNVCTCVSPGNELCFDAEHEPIRFQCAEPVVEM